VHVRMVAWQKVIMGTPQLQTKSKGGAPTAAQIG